MTIQWCLLFDGLLPVEIVRESALESICMLLGSRPAFLMKFAQIDAILYRAIEQNLHPALKKTALRSLTEILKVAAYWKGIRSWGRRHICRWNRTRSLIGKNIHQAFVPPPSRTAPSRLETKMEASLSVAAHFK